MLVSLIRNIFRGSAGVAPRAETVAALVDEGNAHALAGDHAAAIACYDRAILADPALASAHNNRALSLHALGHIREAWAESEWRFQLQDKTHRFLASPPVPRWGGEAIPEGALIVLWEQGLGDVIQHLRFLPALEQRVGKTAFLCPAPLAGLVRHTFPAIEVIESRKGFVPEWNRYAAQVPLLSLPHVLQLDWNTLPNAPYLRAPGRAAWPASEAFEVGIVWRTSGDEPHRDCPLREMLALAASGAKLVSLQFGPTQEEQALLQHAGVPQRVGDFLQTADAVTSVDLVISADTAIVHLAGALGHPVIALLNEPYSVRWTVQGESSPWYPTLQLLRKRRNETWDLPLGRALVALRPLVAKDRNPAGLRLNLGSGQNPAAGYVNVDKFGSPDVTCDLEAFPWPWADNAVAEVLMSHVLEHLGQTPEVFIGVMKELYRVCRGGALVHIRVPHPRHDFYLTDPTHLRPILPATFALFSRRLNEEWSRTAATNTPLALYHGVDFEIDDSHVMLDEPYRTQLNEGRITQAEAQSLVEKYNNVATEIQVTLRVVK